MLLFVKVIVTALIVVAASELMKRSIWAAALLISLPLTSILAMIWMIADGSPTETISRFSTSVFWLVLPSLVFFLLFPLLIKIGWRAVPSLVGAAVGTALIYAGYTRVLAMLNIEI